MKEEEKHLIYRASPLYSIKQNFNERTKQDQISMFLQGWCNGGADFEKHSQYLLNIYVELWFNVSTINKATYIGNRPCLTSGNHAYQLPELRVCSWLCQVRIRRKPWTKTVVKLRWNENHGQQG
ncbi:hypothetical protein NC651_006055 [Populus alba x Populus x berolinensis]|nr:hypothetical protein NC651_006055 [Populus alba x Populus x berolinensis]